MDYENINELDLKLHLLSGDKIDIDNISIEPHKLREIKDIGYTNYINNLQWISLTIDNFIESTVDENKKNFLIEQKKSLKNFDFYIKIGGKEILGSMINSLMMVLKTDDILLLDNGVLGVDFFKDGIYIKDENGEYSVDQEKLESIGENDLKVIHRENFDDIVEVVKLQNYLMKSNEKNGIENPADEEVRKLMEHMKKMREKVESKKTAQRSNDGESDIDISTIISAVSTKSNSINKFNVWELTLYQLYDEYSRLELIDNYELSIKAMMAGASKVKLKHWSSNI